MTSAARTRIGAAAVAALLFTPSVVPAQKPVSVAASITETFTIDAIDHTARVVTLRDKDGLLEDVVCGPEVTRFEALKVGDRVSFTYRESVVSAIRKPGAGGTGPSAAVTRTPGDRPGGELARQVTATVTIEAIDPKVPSVTIRNQAGNKSSFKVENAKNLEGYKVGDQVEITYSQALAISVTPAK